MAKIYIANDGKKVWPVCGIIALETKIKAKYMFELSYQFSKNIRTVTEVVYCKLY